MNRFWVFKVNDYYPNGGMDDCVGKFRTREEAEKCLNEQHADYTYIIDIIEEARDEAFPIIPVL